MISPGAVTALLLISVILLVCAIYIYFDVNATLKQIEKDAEERDDYIG